MDGVRVLDLTRLLPGPTASWLLVGQGACVDVVEPHGGDPTRWMPPSVDGTGAWFAALRRGARSLALDFRHPQAVGVLQCLLPAYDVVMEGFRPGVAEQLGIEPAELVARGQILLRLSGWGQTGPWAARPGHDLNYVAASGALHGAHLPLPVPVADQMAGALAAFGVAAALLGRGRTGQGAVLDLALSDAALAANAPWIAMSAASGRAPEPGGELLTGGSPVYRLTPAADGMASVAALEPRFQRALSNLAGADVDDVIASRSREDLGEAWAEACVVPVVDALEASRHVHHLARGAVVRTGNGRFVRPPMADERWAEAPVPELGAQTDVILAAAGVHADRIAAWREQGVLG